MRWDLAGNAKGDRRKEDQRTCRKIAGGCRSMRDRCRRCISSPFAESLIFCFGCNTPLGSQLLSSALLIIPPHDQVPHGDSPTNLWDELGLRSLHVWPLPTHRRASVTSDCVCSFGNSSPTHSQVTPGRSIALGQSVT
ncbi:hypothetical protein B296_00056086 [Ensete ventricosum]|uniref:Uncharacterized protein n=1 Tax=Ensete ventricosum TaxID=4639 RepID=A0A426XWU9_ENSVE|nr:hypothetical protein B296_00056086 [Ensete ventricosum]